MYVLAQRAGLRVEGKELGLLPDDPARRPGTFFLPDGPEGACLDFVVMSPLQKGNELLLQYAENALAAARAYKKHKLEDRDTANKCSQHDLQLVRW